jgi:hypothetical protein
MSVALRVAGGVLILAGFVAPGGGLSKALLLVGGALVWA